MLYNFDSLLLSFEQGGLKVQRDFRYLRDKYGDAGAREIFEKLCTNLLQAQHGEDAHNIRVSQGDEGIDILVGDFQFPIDNYQCKYFIDGIGKASRKENCSSSIIRISYFFFSSDMVMPFNSETPFNSEIFL